MYDQGSPLIDRDDHGDESEELWLISYADLMTLLFGLFVLLYSFAMAKTPEQVEKVKEGVARSFGGSYTAPLEDLLKKMEVEKLRDPILQDIAIEPLRDGLEVTFQSGLLFKIGESQLDPDIKQTLKTVAKLIAENIDEDQVIVQGHTDDVPINTLQFPSNWELSSVRASSVVREFLKFGFDPQKISAVGLADSQPVVPNKDELGRPIPENRARNRRVVIKIVAPGYIKKRQPASIDG